MNVANAAPVLAQMVSAKRPGLDLSIIPTIAELKAKIPSDSNQWSSFVSQHIQDYVLPRYLSLPPGWILYGIDRLMRAPSEFHFEDPPVNTLIKPNPKRLDYKLRGWSGNDVFEGYNLFISYHLNRGTLPTFATTDEVVNAIIKLTKLESFFIRITASSNASITAGVTLAEVLALYRTEGDLVVPLSWGRYQNRFLTFESDFKPFIYDIEELRPYINFGVWSRPYKNYFSGDPNESKKVDINNKIAKFIALIDWCYLTVGFDYLAMNGIIKHPHPSYPSDSLKLMEFMHNNRIKLLKPSTLTDRLSEIELVVEDLQCIWPETENGRIIVFPMDPVKLLTFILQEAIFFFQISGTPLPPDEKLKYLAYHTQAKRSTDPANDEFTWILVRAAVAAAKKIPPTQIFPSLNESLTALHNSLRNIGLPDPDLFKNIDPKVDSTIYIAAFTMLKNVNWWADTKNLSRLADFVLAAGPEEWNTYNIHRSNCARYARLLEYYRGLTA